MARKKFEFYCSGGCGKYFDFVLNTSLNGNYRIHCPNCNHVHFREVKNGRITDTRFPENDQSVLIEDIYPMKSSCRDYQKETEKEQVQTREGFLYRLWGETVRA